MKYVSAVPHTRQYVVCEIHSQLIDSIFPITQQLIEDFFERFSNPAAAISEDAAMACDAGVIFLNGTVYMHAVEEYRSGNLIRRNTDGGWWKVDPYTVIDPDYVKFGGMPIRSDRVEMKGFTSSTMGPNSVIARIEDYNREYPGNPIARLIVHAPSINDLVVSAVRYL